MDYGLGRRPAPDARDARYPMRALLDPLLDRYFPKGLPPGTRHYRQGAVLDQKQTGTCVAHAWAGWAYGAPLMTKPASMPTPYDLYRQIVLLDEWDDNDNEATAPDTGLQAGTSVRAGVKALQQRGQVQSYVWATTVEDVRAWHLAGFGGVVLGTYWTEEMFDPDGDGFLNYTGYRNAVGGHAYKTTGWSDTVKVRSSTLRTRRAARMLNSWGPGWGNKGRAWIAEDVLQHLLDDAGECCAATEQKIVPV